MTTAHLTFLAAAISLAALPSRPLTAQDAGPGTGGLVRLSQARQALASPHRVLVIGAHPDDEDTELIAILSRGYGAETGYLSLTRGEGGQNLIGGELGAALGVLRTGELLAARRLDGARQYFTRAYDFGYSKSPEETLRYWPRDSVVKDVVRIIRRFQPHAVISTWMGTAADGHGHHQAAGLVSLDAFRAAGDSARFPELLAEEGLPAWQPAKFYRNRGVPAAEGIDLDGGVIDPALGISLHQLAMRARSRHRSQDMGQLEGLGPSSSRIGLELLAPGIEAAEGDSIFAGIPRPRSGERSHRHGLLLAERGIITDAFVDDDEVTPGQAVGVTVLTWNTGTDTVRSFANWTPRPGWRPDTVASDCLAGAVVPPGELARCTIRLRVDPRARPDQPYFLFEPLEGALYTWTGDPASWGEPFEPPLQVTVDLRWPDGVAASSLMEVTARSLDQGLGEVRRPVTIVPRVVLDLSPGSMLWPTSLRSREFTVTLEHAARDSLEASIGMVVPEGWTVDPPVRVLLSRERERRTLTFMVTAPERSQPGEVAFLAQAVIGADTLRIAMRRVDYPHVRPRPLFQVAEASVTVAPVRFPTHLAIGYVRGAADAIPEALAAARVPFRLLTGDDLEGDVLDSLDVLVIGPRAYEVDEALGRAHSRLLAFAEAGGTLITQYQQYQYVSSGLTPYPFAIARPHDRVTDQNAPVRFLPGSEALQAGPNRLGPADFDGWVQERGLYFAREWDDRWTPMIESHDPGEPERQGGLLVARYGRGRVIHTGLSFFRELPAAVPGAWRLFANLLAIGHER
jgi:LmbE family N-acetylglucosaminyl deacetylase